MITSFLLLKKRGEDLIVIDNSNMKLICQITVALAVVVLSESFLVKPIPVLQCSLKNCPRGTKCVLRYGKPRCVRVNPCAVVRCKSGTTCIVKGGKAYCQPDICSLSAETGLCKAYFKRYFYNTTSARCEEFVYGGCGGNKNNFVKKEHCKAKCDNPGPCPADKPLHYCFVPPCLTATCPAYPGAECVNNYCGGCNAEFYVDNKQKQVKCACSPPLTIHHCKVAPCDLAPKCEAYPDAKCVNYYCGGCFAHFYLNGRKVDCKKNTLPDSCAAILCQVGHICVVRNGKASCQPACKSNSDCKQQGSFCNSLSGVCECSPYCPEVYSPVCGSDNKLYGNMCKLNSAACMKKTTITPAPCQLDSI